MSLRILIENKKLEHLEEDEVVKLHLESIHVYETLDFYIQSTLSETELTMRQSRGNANLSRYAPLLCGFAILDQIGGCYSNSNVSMPPGKKGIRHALHFFGNYDYNSPESKYLYVLRNGLVHDASFVDCDLQGNWRVFRLDWDISSEIILPRKLWDGDYNNVTQETITWINPRKFTDRISDILLNVRDILDNNPRQLKVLIKKEEMLSKYFDIMPKNNTVFPKSIL